MKLTKDFGVRALLAIIAAIGYYVPLVFIFLSYELSTETMLALLGAASSPWLLAMGFYFGTRAPENPPVTPGPPNRIGLQPPVPPPSPPQ